MCGVLQAAFTATTTVTPGTESLDGDVASQLDASMGSVTAPGIAVASVQPATVAPVCGNLVCETGELCGATDDNCCIRDCPTRRVECPTAAGSSDPCSGHGSCDYVTGACSCYGDTGYAGDDCSACAGGLSAEDSGIPDSTSAIGAGLAPADPGTRPPQRWIRKV